jgi:hypothetical protein
MSQFICRLSVPLDASFKLKYPPRRTMNPAKLCASSFLSTMVAFEHSCHLLAERSFHPARFLMASYTDASQLQAEAHLKISIQATMVVAAVFAAICLSVAITGFTSLSDIADPTEIADAKGFAWFWIFLASVAIGLAA